MTIERDTRAPAQPGARSSSAPPGWIALRGPSGRLYGYLEPSTLIVELKRKGESTERINLRELLAR